MTMQSHGRARATTAASGEGHDGGDVREHADQGPAARWPRRRSRIPNFDRTVIYVLEHHDEGALGVVINRPSPEELGVPLDAWAEVA